MNQDQISGMARILVPAVCAWLASKGATWFDLPEVQTQIATMVVGVAALIWSYLSHSNGAKLRTAAAIDPQIKISVPEHVVASSPEIARLVYDPTTTNVTETR